MKVLTTTLLLSVGGTLAFAPVRPQSSFQDTSSTSLSAMNDRRQFIDFVATTVAGAMVVAPGMASAEPRPMYLTEPTAEFKENEAKAADFKRQQLMAKKELMTALDKLLAEPDNEEALVKDLKDIQSLIAKVGGLPLGIKKEDMYKMIRTKKAKGFWPTSVEVA